MQDSKYCYPDSEVLINLLNITDGKELFEAEKMLTSIRLRELQETPIKGKFDFAHLKAIHKYIFQDLYDWAGKERTAEIGKGNLFCLTPHIQSYANAVFSKYFSQCFVAKDNIEDFVRVFSENYGDLNALHPFREGNGRTQREFARLVCLECGYDFDLSCTTHKDMLEASIASFDKGDNSYFIKIFSSVIRPIGQKNIENESNSLKILTADDMVIEPFESGSPYDYYESDDCKNSSIYSAIYMAKIDKMNAERIISENQNVLNAALSTPNQEKSEDV